MIEKKDNGRNAYKEKATTKYKGAIMEDKGCGKEKLNKTLETKPNG